jgi:hypothetical protein
MSFQGQINPELLAQRQQSLKMKPAQVTTPSVEIADEVESEIADLELELELIADARIPQGTNPSDPLNRFQAVSVAELDAQEAQARRRLTALRATA